jgi:hypothetical protein
MDSRNDTRRISFGGLNTANSPGSPFGSRVSFGAAAGVFGDRGAEGVGGRVGFGNPGFAWGGAGRPGGTFDGDIGVNGATVLKGTDREKEVSIFTVLFGGAEALSSLSISRVFGVFMISFQPIYTNTDSISYHL